MGESRAERRRNGREAKRGDVLNTGQFRGPCGDLVVYATEIPPSRRQWVRVFSMLDHLPATNAGGKCSEPEACGAEVDRLSRELGIDNG